MKSLNLEKLGVQEMDAVEVKSTDGGIWWFIAGIIASELLDRSSGSDFMDGYNAAKR